MTAENRCPACNTELAANAPRGLCPACLLKGGLASQSGGGSNPSPADFVPPTPAELTPLFPDLEIIELVGRGGMGVVYKARQKRLDRLVALKILSPRVGQDRAFADRFAREARAMAMLNYPHIVAVYDFGQTASPLHPREGKSTGEGANLPSPISGRGTGDEVANLPSPVLGRGAGGEGSQGGLYYFLMEFVDGLNVRQLLETGKLAPKEALAIVPQICEALQYAHDHGVVHRDIKPENVLLDKQGQVKIADFGIAKLVGRPETDPTLTGAGQIVGTPQYMAPEQIEHPLQVDHRADIYSLGVVFYQMLTGELPIGRFAPPSKKVQIDVRLDEVVLRALEKEPALRYQQASEIKCRVETIVTSPMPDNEAPRDSVDGADNTMARPEVAADSRKRGAALPKKRVKAWMKKTLWSIPFVLGLVILLNAFVLQLFRVPTDAVAPDIPQGSRILVFKLAREYSPGDIAVYRADGHNEVARVVEAGPKEGRLLVQRRNQSPQEISAADLMGRVVLNTRAERRTAGSAAAPNPPIGSKPTAAERVKDIQPLDVLRIDAISVLPPINGYYVVEPDGNVALGPLNGRVNVDGLTMEQAAGRIARQLGRTIRDPLVQVTFAMRPDKWWRAVFPKLPYAISSGDLLCVIVPDALPDAPIDNYYVVEPLGTIALGPAYGRVQVGGLSLEAAEKAVQKKLEQIIKEPLVQITLMRANTANLPGMGWEEVEMPKAPYAIKLGDLLFIDASGTVPDQPIQGVMLVEPTRTVALGPMYGRVKVEGLTLEAAQRAIEKKLHEDLAQPEVSVTLAGWMDPRSPSIGPGPQSGEHIGPHFSPGRKGPLLPKANEESPAEQHPSHPGSKGPKSSELKTDPSISSVKLRYAQQQFEQTESQYKSGTATFEDFLAAKRDRDVAAADVQGDKQAAARARLQYAKYVLKVVEERFKSGTSPLEGVLTAKRDRDVATAEVQGDEQAAAKAKLQYAEDMFKTVDARYEAGTVTAREYVIAKRDRDVAAMEMKGDPVTAAWLRLHYSESILQMTKAQHESGVLTTEDVLAADRDRDLAAAELHRLEETEHVKADPLKSPIAVEMRTVVLALLEYAIEHPNWPKTLNELTPKYIDAGKIDFQEIAYYPLSAESLANDPREVPVLALWPVLAGGQFVGFADGYVEFIQDPQRLKRLFPVELKSPPDSNRNKKEPK